MAEDFRGMRGDRIERGDGPIGRAPETTEEARLAIERTRGRISATLDAIEERVSEKRDELRGRVDVLRPTRERIRSHIWPSLAVAFGVGFLVAGRGREEEVKPAGRMRPGKPRDGARMLDEDEREELRRWRAERRARLKSRSRVRRPREGRRGGIAGRFLDAVLSGVTGGLDDRVRRGFAGR